MLRIGSGTARPVPAAPIAVVRSMWGLLFAGTLKAVNHPSDWLGYMTIATSGVGVWWGWVTRWVYCRDWSGTVFYTWKLKGDDTVRYGRLASCLHLLSYPIATWLNTSDEWIFVCCEWHVERNRVLLAGRCGEEFRCSCWKLRVLLFRVGLVASLVLGYSC